MITRNRPDHILENHWIEWVEQSGVLPEITAQCVSSAGTRNLNQATIARKLNWSRGQTWMKNGWIVEGIFHPL